MDDDDESVKLGFGSALPARVSAGTRTETTLNIGDNDNPIVTVMFAQTTHTVDEGGYPEGDRERECRPGAYDHHSYRDHAPGHSQRRGLLRRATQRHLHLGGHVRSRSPSTATQDVIDDDAEGVKLAFGTMPDPRVSAGTPAGVTLTITDDDTADIVLSSMSLTVTEGGSSDYTVRLATEPTVDVTVTISGHAGTDLTLAGTRLNGDALIFTPDNWNSLRTVTVAAGHDLDGVNDDATLTHTAGGGEYASLQRPLPVTVNRR